MLEIIAAGCAIIGIIYKIWKDIDTRTSSRKPTLNIFYQSGKTHTELIELVIKNEGPGIARNIHFDVLEGGDFVTISNDKIKDLAIIKEGIDSSSPNGEDRFILTDLSENYVQSKMNVKIKISARCEDDHGKNYRFGPFEISLKKLHGLRLSSSDNEMRYTCPSGNVHSDKPP